jgi:hypothetical protein
MFYGFISSLCWIDDRKMAAAAIKAEQDRITFISL